MKKTIASISLVFCSVLLVSCGHEGHGEQQGVKPKPQQGQQAPVVKNPSTPAYLAYREGVIGNGGESLLFFHADWCKTCKAKDAEIAQWYQDESLSYTTYKVDFDSAVELKKQYGITMQDTFVLIDGAGNVIKQEVAPPSSLVKRILFGNIEEAQAADMEDKMEEAPEAEEIMEKMEKEEAPEVASETSYAEYSDGVVGNGKESVLFFHAAWCPACIGNDKKIQAWYDGENFGRSIYKVDYDTAADLKAKYGVTGQDTFILIDGSGNEIKRERFPSEDALKELLG